MTAPLLKTPYGYVVPNGVRPSRNKWLVSVRQAYLGTYDDLEDASRVRLYFEKHHGEVTDTNELLRLHAEAVAENRLPAPNSIRQLRLHLGHQDVLAFGTVVVCKEPKTEVFAATIVRMDGTLASVLPLGSQKLVEIRKEFIHIPETIEIKARI